MLQILTGVQAGILTELDLDLVQISFDSLLRLDLNLIGLAIFDFIMALIKLKSISFLLCTNPLI